MTGNGIGGKTKEAALSALQDMTKDTVAIGKEEFEGRIQKAQALMKAQGIAALYLNAGTNMTYFTGLEWYASERLVGVVPAGRPGGTG